ncbi:MAG TPA: hypothetical protein VMQ54_07705, partial [Steroidobacteraceae bacterium]|nr:hypothetical protein [Steroidobacteraceae bacterium]
MARNSAALTVSLDVDSVCRAVSTDVNDSGICLGFREARNATWLRIEASGRQCLLGRGAGGQAVTEVPEAGDHNGGRFGNPASLQDLGQHRGIIYGNRGGADWRFRVGRKWIIARPEVALRVNNGLLIARCGR